MRLVENKCSDFEKYRCLTLAEKMWAEIFAEQEVAGGITRANLVGKFTEEYDLLKISKSLDELSDMGFIRTVNAKRKTDNDTGVFCEIIICDKTLGRDHISNVLEDIGYGVPQIQVGERFELLAR